MKQQKLAKKKKKQKKLKDAEIGPKKWKKKEPEKS